MKSKILLYCLLLTVFGLHGQSFRHYAEGLDIRTFYHQQGINYYLSTADEKGQVYSIHYDTVTSGFNFGKEYSVIRLQIFNGISWLYTKPIRLFSLHSIDAPRVLDIQYKNGEVFVCGSFDSTEHQLSAGLIQYDGKDWKGSSCNLLKTFPDYFEVRQILSFQNQLMITGNFDSIPGQRVNGLLWHDGNTWKPIGFSEPYGFNNLSGINNVFFQVVKDSVFAFNKNKIKPDSIEIGGEIFKKLAVFNAGNFSQVNTNSTFIAGIAAYGKKTIVLPSSQLGYCSNFVIKEVNNWSSFSFIDSFYATNYLGSYEKNNILFFLFQNPTVARIEIYSFDGSKVQKQKSFKLANQYLNLEFISENSSNLISGPFFQASIGNNSENHNSIVGLLFEPATVLSGICYKDVNNDGQRQINEPIFPGCKVYDAQNTYMCLSDANGNYRLKLPIGKSLNIGASNNLSYGLGQVIQINNSSDSVYQIDLGLIPIDKNDLSVFITPYTGNKAKQGFLTSYHVEVENNTSVQQTISVKITYADKLSNISFDGFNPLSQGSNYFTVAPNLASFTQQSFTFTGIYAVDSFTLGEKVNVIASFSAFDAISSNNADTVRQIVVAAFDPNIKVASPDLVVNNQKEISYVIWFQNLGNDSALNVTVVDTFGSLLNLSSVHVGVNSHGNINPSVINNCLIWNFRNIKLAPKKVDSIGSIGFVSFRSKLTVDAKVGDTIFNKAAIFFDYQKPVITNAAKVVFVKQMSIAEDAKQYGFSLYPNPSNGRIYYENKLDIEGVFEILDVSGRMVCSFEVREGKGSFDLPSSLAAGIYIIHSSALHQTLGKIIFNP